MSDKPLPTKERLAQAIEKRAGDQPGQFVRQMIQRARAGYYDDFESELAAPMMKLVEDCRAMGFTDLAQRVIDGEFDGTREEGDAWFQREGHNMLKGEKKARGN